jgi:putative transposase
MVTASAKRELVRFAAGRGLSERHALRIADMSAGALRYTPAPDRNTALRGEIVRLAQCYRRYGAAMIYLKLRQQGWTVNHKRVERLYAAQGLQVRRRKRKKVPVSDRQPLLRPATANTVWSMDFVFDRIADGRPIKCLAIVDDATHECVALVPAKAMSGAQVTRVLDRLADSRGLPRVIRSDNGAEFIGKAMLNWAYDNSVQLKQIEPGKPNQNAYIESFNSRLRDECLNEHWFTSMAHAIAMLGGWQREYNEERPKKGLAGLTPAAYAEKLPLRQKSSHVNPGL